MKHKKHNQIGYPASNLAYDTKNICFAVLSQQHTPFSWSRNKNLPRVLCHLNALGIWFRNVAITAYSKIKRNQVRYYKDTIFSASHDEFLFQICLKETLHPKCPQNSAWLSNLIIIA